MTEANAYHAKREGYDKFMQLRQVGVKRLDEEGKDIEEDDVGRPSKQQRHHGVDGESRVDLGVPKKESPVAANDLRERVLTNYTPDQEGKDIKETDVVRPSNRRYCRKSAGVHDEEIRSWKWKSNARAPTHGSCGGCMKSGPLGKVCMDCDDKGWKNDYRMMKDGQKILDSITLAEIFGQGHEVAKADRFCTPEMQVMREHDTCHIDQTFRNLIRNKGIVFGCRERERIKRAYDEMVGDG